MHAHLNIARPRKRGPPDGRGMENYGNFGPSTAFSTLAVSRVLLARVE